MPRRITTSRAATLSLSQAIESEVAGWRNQGYHPLPTETTLQLLRHWFDEQGDADEKFHPCQRHAIETIIYLHEILGIRSIRQLYEKFEPSWLKISDEVKAEANTPFMKYCCKMATGSGKTWVLAGLVIWQYFNAINGETAPSGLGYSPRFVVVAPGHEVLNRLLDSFKGPRDPKTHNRLPERSDYRRGLFVPQDAHWKGRFNLLDQILEPGDLRANTTPPDGPFVAIVNWQQFRMDDGKESLAEQYGLSLPEMPQGEIIADFLTEFPDLIVMNDEAHHVHGKKNAKAEELVWRKFMTELNKRMAARHGKDRGLFLQVDFSATPFYGTGDHREYFPHIVYDYDLRQAMNHMLVKQLFLEERQSEGKKKFADLDFRATRTDADKGKRGAAIKLTNDQKMIIDIGVSKLNQLTHDLRKQFDRKPVLMILCEDTTVADMVHGHLVSACQDFNGNIFKPRQILLFHSELKKETHGYTMEEARGAVKATGDHPTLAGIDDDHDPLQVVVSVLALREGFDKTNICVTAVLRATEADMLLEQIVGRGLRLMFPDYKYPGPVQDAKQQAFEALRRREKPENSLDFLYIVEHPRFKAFYEELRRKGDAEIGGGDSSDIKPTGDLIPVDSDNARVPQYDIAWPAVVQDETSVPAIEDIEVATLPSGTWDIDQLRSALSTISITDYHPETDTKANTWNLRDRFFDYSSFIASTSDLIAKDGRAHHLTGRRSDIAAIVDEYTRTRLFKREIDFDDPDNYKVLAYRQVQDYVVDILRRIIADHIGQPTYEVRGYWRRLSDLSRIQIREQAHVKARRCIYPKVGYSPRHGGLERDVMRELLEGSPDVLAWCKLQRRHGLTIVYRDETSLQRTYEVDFVLRTVDSCFLLETKSDDDLSLPSVGLKAQAAKSWCERICGVPLPQGDEWGDRGEITQPLNWEYLLLSESLFHANRNVSFTALLPMMRTLRDQVIAQQFHGSLFVQ
jgi:type III restriction enzyme